MSLFTFRKKTSRTSNKANTLQRGSDIHRLHLKVNSPRIMLIQIQRGIVKGLKWAVILALLGAIGWGGITGIQKSFLKNPKYKLQHIKLSTNGHLDYDKVVKVAHIDLNASIFEIDPDAVSSRLESLPEVIKCNTKQQLPGTLSIQLIERVPVVWLKSDSLNLPGRAANGIFADKNGIIFPCEANLWQSYKNLPTIVIEKAPSNIIQLGKKINHPDTLRALQLISLFNKHNISDDLMPDQVILSSSYSMEVICKNGSHAIFGMYDHDRQMSDFIKIYKYTKKTHRTISKINLIPKKNIPVRFADAPVLVKPSSKPHTETTYNQEIQSILNRN